jgi:hypothetical protein
LRTTELYRFHHSGQLPASRFARLLVLQELGLQMLRCEGVQLVALGKPDAFMAIDDPMVEAVRQMLGVMSQLEKAMTVAKLRSCEAAKLRSCSGCSGEKGRRHGRMD